MQRRSATLVQVTREGLRASSQSIAHAGRTRTGAGQSTPPPNTPKALQARGGDRKEESEGPASHTPTHRNVQTITMQVSGRLETSMLVPFWGDGLKNTNKILPLLSIFQPNHFGKRQQEKKKKACSFNNEACKQFNHTRSSGPRLPRGPSLCRWELGRSSGPPPQAPGRQLGGLICSRAKTSSLVNFTELPPVLKLCSSWQNYYVSHVACNICYFKLFEKQRPSQYVSTT